MIIDSLDCHDGHVLTKGHAVILVGELDGRVAADVVMLYSWGTSMARIYSTAVTAPARGKGFASGNRASRHRA